MEPSWPPASGTVLEGAVTLGEVLGRGPTGVVYAAESGAWEGTLVAKLLHPSLFKGDAAAVNTARVEAQVDSPHPAFAELHAWWLNGDCPALILERLKGVTLSQWLTESPRLSFAQVVEVAEKLVGPLHALHRDGFHGNLHPENIFVQADGDLRLSDPWFFEGLGGLDDEGLPGRDTSWLAPEQASGRWEGSVETDIYRLALIVGYLLAGRPVMGSQSLLEQRVFVSPEVDAVYRRATNLRPGDRYADVLDFWASFDLAWQTSQEEVDGESSIGGTITDMEAGSGWGPGTIAETQLVPPATSLADVVASRESDAAAFRELEEDLDTPEPEGPEEAFRLDDSGEDVKAMEVEQGTDEPAEPSAGADEDTKAEREGRSTSVIARGGSPLGNEMVDFEEWAPHRAKAMAEEASTDDEPEEVDGDEPPEDHGATLNVRMGRSWMKEGRAEATGIWRLGAAG